MPLLSICTMFSHRGAEAFFGGVGASAVSVASDPLGMAPFELRLHPSQVPYGCLEQCGTSSFVTQVVPLKEFGHRRPRVGVCKPFEKIEPPILHEQGEADAVVYPNEVSTNVGERSANPA